MEKKQTQGIDNIIEQVKKDADDKFLKKIKQHTEREGLVIDKVSTALLDKNFSPLIVRKYQVEGWPLYIGLICDISLSDLDHLIWKIIRDSGQLENDIQNIRNLTGIISDKLLEHYNNIKEGCVEGIAVIYYCDKMMVSSLWGDFMTHLSCKMELYSIIQTLPHI